MEEIEIDNGRNYFLRTRNETMDIRGKNPRSARFAGLLKVRASERTRLAYRDARSHL